jgi:hypothetical protein
MARHVKPVRYAWGVMPYDEWFFITSDEGRPRGDGYEVMAGIYDRRTQALVGSVSFTGYGRTVPEAREEAEANARRRALRLARPALPRYSGDA